MTGGRGQRPEPRVLVPRVLVPRALVPRALVPRALVPRILLSRVLVSRVPLAAGLTLAFVAAAVRPASAFADPTATSPQAAGPQAYRPPGTQVPGTPETGVPGAGEPGTGQPESGPPGTGPPESGPTGTGPPGIGPASVGQASAFAGTDAVGALFLASHGHLYRHFCTASVVPSPAGNLVITAAHCVAGMAFTPPGRIVFAPGYHDGLSPHGTWIVRRKFVTARWAAGRDPNDDVAFLVVSGPGATVEQVAGAEQLSFRASLPALVEAIGYPDSGNRPISCSGTAVAPEMGWLRQLMFACDGFTIGTSGGPLLADVSAVTGAGTIIGVIGGYQTGGYTADVSYSALLAANIAALYQRAVSLATNSPAQTSAAQMSASQTQSDRIDLSELWRRGYPAGSFGIALHLFG